MATLHTTEAELARNVHAFLAKVREGAEVVIEEDHHAVAVIRSPLPEGRSILECIAIAESFGSRATLDDGFMNDVEAGIAERNEPWTPLSWD